ncbi:MAG: ClpXP protease specificity-enhancing factor [Gammaproteobacteria bacterium]|nr:MAG: ClpXP protease specificity-enhancing factor [Gammaproteobacteria bacterium]
MTSSRPYLIRALYEWISENDLTPYVLVDAQAPSTVVPKDYVENGKIVLNIGGSSVQGLTLGNDVVEFSARFSGQSMQINVPVSAILAIYARENGQGMVFNEEGDTAPPTSPTSPPASGKPHLKLVT